MSTSEHTVDGAKRTPTTRPHGSPKVSVAGRLALDKLSGVYCWAGLLVLFALWVPTTFLTAATVRSISASSSVTFLLALALIVPLACGLFDLSIAATLGVASVLVIHLQSQGASMLEAVALTVLAGVGIGAVNGALVVGVGIDSFIATLGMSSVLAALGYWISDGNQLVAAVPSRFVSLGQGSLFGLPHAAWVALVVAAVLLYVTEWTTVGRYLYAIGGNMEAARLVGIRVDRIRLVSLVASGALASLAGVVLAAQLGSSSADVGPAYLLPAFSAVLLGATQVKTSGRVNVLGTFVAVILLATGIYGLQLAGAPTFISSLFNGLALILAVSLALRANRRG